MTTHVPNWIKLNNEIIIQKDGKFQFDKDKEAVYSYFVDFVNQNTVFFHDLKEKLDYLIENDYYDEKTFRQYEYKDLKKLYKFVYSKKFRFPSFMSAFKFYNNYALKTNDGKKFLERYEDRIAATALFLAEGDFNKAMWFAEEMIERRYQPATPTFLNAGKKRRGELVSCFLLMTDDSMNAIANAVHNALQLSKRGGGVSHNLTDLRALGDPIKGIENRCSGVVPVMKLLEDSYSYANQLGSRDGAGAVWLNIFHLDVIDFLSTKKINADEKARIKTLSLGLIVPDKFFELVEKDYDMYLFSPYGIYKEYGKRMSEINITEMYDELVENPNIRKKKISARDLLTMIAQLQVESGYPYFFFEDNTNKVHPLKNEGKVKFSNLCVTGDTLLLTNKGYKTARELYESQEELKVIIDNRTKNYDVNEKGVSIVNAIPMQLTQKNANVFKVTTKQGFEIKATEWHKMYVKRNNRIEKIDLKDLRVGDQILIQSGEGAYGDFHDPDLAYIMGVIAGDGTITDKTVKIYLYDNKKVHKAIIEEKVKNIIKRYLDRDVKHNASLEPKFNEVDKGLLILHSGLLHYILSSKFNVNKENKTEVPQFVLNGTKETQCAYLSGLYQMDGTVNANFKTKALTIELVQINKNLLKDIQRMLINMGIYSTIYEGRKKGKNLLPDGKGSEKYYEVKPTYKLSIQDRQSRELFVKNIKLKDYDMYKFNLLTDSLQPTSKTPKHDFTATVTSIDFYGVEDVYDTTQPDYHSLIFNGIVTGNCTEIIQLSETSVINDFGEEHEIKRDISCNLGSLNIVNVMETKKLESAVAAGMRMLDAVARMTNISIVPSVAKANKEMRSVGLGAMNLHGFLAKNKIPYESKEALEFVDVFFAAVNYYSILESMKIAKETGFVFKGFKGSDYETGEYFEMYLKEDFSPKSEKIKKLFEGIKLPTKEDWKKLKDEVKQHGLAHAYRLAIAPTGSISYVQSSTASIAPITEKIEHRTYGDSDTYYPMPYMNESNYYFYKEAYDMDMFKMIDLYATVQKHIDQGISCTLYVKDTITTRELSMYYIYAWKKGLKTLYYTRTKMTNNASECVNCVV